MLNLNSLAGFATTPNPSVKPHKDLSILIIKSDSFEKMIGSLTRSFGASGSSIIYIMGKENGVNEVKQLREELKSIEYRATKKDLLEKVLLRISNLGWGKISLDNYDSFERTVDVRVKHNPFQLDCSKKEKNGCLFLHGYIAGLVSEAMEEEMEFTNPRCAERKKESCTFKLKRKNSTPLISVNQEPLILVR